jgi:ZIP family zinc transporter
MLGTVFIPTLKYGHQETVTAGALGFAAGVMLYVSFVDVLGEEAKEFFENHFNSQGSLPEDSTDDIRVRIWIAAFFFVGLAIATGLDALLSRAHGRSDTQDSRDLEMCGLENSLAKCEGPSGTCGTRASSSSPTSTSWAMSGTSNSSTSKASLERVSLVAFVALTLHNIPEGLATFLGGGAGSLTVPFAIAVHNVPEGAAIAIPTYQATGSMLRAMKATFIAAMAQPAGAAVGWLCIIAAGTAEVPAFCYGAMYSVTAGIMVAVALMELIPEALEIASPRFVICWAFIGFFVMEASIVLLSLSEMGQA